MKNGFRRTLAMLAAVCTLALGAAAAEDNSQNANEAQAQTGMRFTIRTEETVRGEAGMDVRAWEAEADARRQRGLDSPISREEMTAADPDAVFHLQNGRVYMIDGLAESLAPVSGVMDAYETVYRLSGMLGGGADTQLRLWSVLTADEQTVYVFQQVYEGLTVIASTAKLVAGPDGRVRTVFSSLADVQPAGGNTDVDAARAEEIVRAYLRERGGEDTVMSEYTTRAVIPMEDDSEEHADEVLPDQLAWIVFSENPRFRQEYVVDLPYMAHYVSMTGEYLGSSAVTVPGDSAAQGGYPSAYAFEFMEESEWTGEVTDTLGASRTLTVPVMRDSRTGIWYLGDAARKIAVAEFAAFAYGEERVVMVSSPDNSGWKDEDLITYANMIRVWDFYAASGWIGPDGVGTPVLMLRNLVTEKGEPMVNAAYAGISKGWQCFAFGADCGLGQALDVMAHEFTHCVTSSTMNTNLYQDDMGAINEAMSDILGNICEGIAKEGTDKRWLMGEDSGMVVRSMLDPHDYDQPDYVWDIFYVPHAYRPNDANDRGGVHYNSSILNRVAARLCEDAGMPLENARDFWMTVALGMTPQTDYPQMVPLMGWALEVSGNGAYREALNRLTAEVRMSERKMPDTLPEGQRTVSLTLPETEAFADDHWVMLALQVDVAEIRGRIQAIWDYFTSNPASEEEAMTQFSDLLERLHLKNLQLVLEEGDETEAERILRSSTRGLASQHFTWRSTAGGDLTMVAQEQPTFYVLMNVDSREMNIQGMVLLLDDEWFDVGRLIQDSGEADPMETIRMLGKAWDQLSRFLDPEKAAAETGDVILPTNGLETVELTPIQLFAETESAAETEPAPQEP